MERRVVETALCIWEWILQENFRHPEQCEDLPRPEGLREFYEAHGTSAVRQFAITLAPAVNALWDSLSQAQKEHDDNIPYDWGFVPRVMSMINWIDKRENLDYVVFIGELPEGFAVYVEG